MSTEQIKSQSGGRLMVDQVRHDYVHALPQEDDSDFYARLTDLLNSRLASPWLPLSTPPTEADADRNGNVEFLRICNAIIGPPVGFVQSGKWDGNYFSYHYWRHTNLPDLPVEKEDAFEKVNLDAAYHFVTQGSTELAFKEVWTAALASVKGEK